MPLFQVNNQPAPFSFKVASINAEDYEVAPGVTHIIYRSTVEGNTVTLPSASAHPNRFLSIINNSGDDSVILEGIIKATDEEETVLGSVSPGNSIEIISDGADWVLTKQTNINLYL